MGNLFFVMSNNIRDWEDATTVYLRWYSPTSCDAYLFCRTDLSDDGLKEIKETLNAKEEVGKVKVVKGGRVYTDDSVEIMLGKFLELVPTNHNTIEDVYAWNERSLDSDELNELLRGAMGSSQIVSGRRLADICWMLLGVRVRAVSEDGAYTLDESIELLNQRNKNGLSSPLNLVFKHKSVDRRVLVAPVPWRRGEVEPPLKEVRRVYSSVSRIPNDMVKHRTKGNAEYSIVNLLLRKDVVESWTKHCAVYFTNGWVDGLQREGAQIVAGDAVIEEIRQGKTWEAVSEVQERVQMLSFRVLPLDYQREVNISMVFRRIGLSKEIPMVVHYSTHTTLYKTSRDHLGDVPRWIIERIQAKEIDNQDRVVRRSQESLMLLMVEKELVYQIVLSSNGSYRVIYNFRRDTNATINDVQATYTAVGRVVENIDRAYYKIDRGTDIYKNDKIEVIEQKVSVRLLLNRKMVTQDRLISNLRSMTELFSVIDDSRLVMKYKRVNDYKSADAITAFLHKHAQLDQDELIRKTATEFGLSVRVAEGEVLSKRERIAPAVRIRGRKVFASSRMESGMIVRMNTRESSVMRLKVSDVTNPIFLRNMLLAVVHCAISRKSRKSDSKYRDVDGSDAESEEEEQMEESRIDEDTMGEMTSYMDMLNIGDEYMDEMSEFMMSDDGMLTVNVENDVPSLEHEEEHNEEGEAEEDDDESEEDAASKDTYTTFVLNKLIEADHELFSPSEKDRGRRRVYASRCGAVDYRQPVVITAEEKQRIDNKYPNSYTGYVKTGSTDELRERNFYICPRIWCRFNRVSVTEKDLGPKGMCPGEFGEEPLFFPPKGKKNYFINSKGVEMHVPMLMKSSLHPKGYRMPCCARTGDTTDEETVTRYAARVARDFPLSAGRMGTLPAALHELMGNRPNGCVGMLSKRSECVVRMGMDTERSGSMAQALERAYDIDNVYEWIADRLEVWEYIAMNGGATLRVFSDPSDWTKIKTKKDLREFGRYLYANETYVEMFGLEPVVEEVRKLLSSKDQPLEEDASSSWSIALRRELNILASFKRYKTYLKSPEFAKIDTDVLHAMHFPSTNKEECGVLIVDCPSESRVRLVTPMYYDLRSELAGKKRFVCMYRVGPNQYELLYRFSTVRSGAIFERSELMRILREVGAPATEPPNATGYLISYSMKWVGTCDSTGAVVERFPAPRYLRSGSLQSGVTVRFDEVPEDALAFVNSRLAIASSQVRKEKRLSDIISKLRRSTEARKRFDELTHWLNPMSRAARISVASELIVRYGRSVSEEEVRELAPMVATQPLSFLEDERREENAIISINDIIVLREDAVKGGLLSAYDKSIRRTRIWDDTWDDVVVKGYETEEMQVREPQTYMWWSDPNTRSVELRPRALAKLFPKLEILDRDVSAQDVIDIVDRCRYEDFVEHMVDTLSNLPANKQSSWLGKNPNATNADKRWLVEDYRSMLTDNDREFHYGHMELRGLSELTGKGIIIVGRSHEHVPNGVLVFNPRNEEDGTEFLILHYRREEDPSRYVYRLVVSSRTSPMVSASYVPDMFKNI